MNYDRYIFLHDFQQFLKRPKKHDVSGTCQLAEIVRIA